jgi:hypothetical protein
VRFTKFFLAVSMISALMHAAASAGDVELAYLVRPLDGNRGVLVRADGTAWEISKGVGCPGLETTEGTRVLVESEGAFLRPYDSWLIFPDGQRCKIHDSRPLGPLENAPDVDDVIDQALTEDERYTLVEVALKALGYYTGDVPGVDGAFDDALLGFKKNAGLEADTELDPATIILVTRDLQDLYPDDPGRLSIALTLREDAARTLMKRPGCRRLSVSDVYRDRGALGLGNAGLAVIESDSRLLARCERGDDVVICGVTLVSMKTGEVARVRVVSE